MPIRRLLAFATLLAALLALPGPAVAGTSVTWGLVFAPDTIGPGSASQAVFTISNSGPGGATNLAFSVTFPAGVTMAAPASGSTDCIGGLVSAPGGGTTLSLSGAILGGGESCTVVVDVVGTATATTTTGDLTSSEGNSGTATDDLTVDTSLPGVTKSFVPDAVDQGQDSRLTFTFDNTANGADVENLDLTDNLPAGVVVADLPDATTTCGDPLIPATFDPQAGDAVVVLDSNGSGAFPALDAGATCTASVNVTAAGPGALLNRTEPGLADFVDAGFAVALLDVTAQPFRKQVTNNPVTPGGVVDFEFTVENSTGSGFDGGGFTDDLDAFRAGSSISGALPSDPCGADSVLSFATGTLTLSGAEVEDADSCTFTVSVQLPGGEPLGDLPNTTSDFTATSTGEGGGGRGTPDGTPVTLDAASDIAVIAYRPTLTPTFDPNPVAVGGTTRLTLSVTNTDPLNPVADVLVVEDVSELTGATGATAVTGAGFCNAGSTSSVADLGTQPRLEVTIDTMNAGETCEAEFDLDIPAGGGGGVFPVVVDTFTYGTTPGAKSPTSLTIVRSPSVALSILDEATPVLAGGTTALELELAYGDEQPNLPDATGVGLTINLDAGLSGLTGINLPVTDACGPGNGTIAGSAGDGFLTLAGVTLSADEPCVVQVDLQVPANAPPGAHTITTSSITGTVDGLAVTAPGDSDDLNVVAIVVTKEFLDEPAIQGLSTTLRFTVENLTASDNATNIFFTDVLDQEITGMTAVDDSTRNDVCGDGDVTFAGGGSFLILSGGNLAPGISCTFDIELNVPVGVDNGAYRNATSQVTYNVPSGGAVALPAIDTLTIDNAIILASKSFIDDPVRPGDTGTLEYTLANSSTTQAITAITFADDLSAAGPGVMAVGLPANDVCGTGSTITGTTTVTLTGGTLSPGATCTFSITFLVPAGTGPGSVGVSSTSAISGTASGVAVSGNVASDTLTIAGVVDFAKAFSGLSAAGQEVDLTFTLTNPSATASFTGLRFSDDLDAVLSGLAVSGALPTDPCGSGSTLSGTTTVSLVGGSLGPSETCTIPVTLQVPAGAVPGTYANVTSDLIDAPTVVAQPATATLSIEPPPTFAKAFNPGSIAQGSQSTLTYTIDNSASSLSATALSFTDTFPSGVRVRVSPAPSSGCGGTLTAPANGGTVSLSGGTVAAGSTCTVTIMVTGVSPGVHIGTTDPLTSSNGDSGTATGTLVVAAPTGGGVLADFAVTATPDASVVAPGDEIDFTFTVTNNGPEAAAGTFELTVSDLVEASALSGCASSSVATPCALPSLSPGETVDITATTTHNTIGMDQVVGVARAAGTDPSPDNDAAIVNVTVDPDGESPLTPDQQLVVDNAIAISKERFPSTATFAGTTAARFAVLARVDVFADALAGSVLTREAPLLFTHAGELLPETATELARVVGDGGTVYLLGGEVALSPGIEAALTELGLTPQRLEGASRVQTALAVADEARGLYGGSTVGVVRAFGTEDNPTAAWADSVAGGGWSAESRTPLVLTDTFSLHPDVSAWLTTNVVEGGVTILGGPAAISEDVADELAPASRVQGPERGATAAAIASELRGVPPTGPRSYLLVNGFAEDGWAYGLVAAGLSSDTGAPVLLTNRESAPPSTQATVTSCVDEPVDLRRMAPASELSDDLLAQLDSLDDSACEVADEEGTGEPDPDPPDDIDNPASP